MKKNSAGIVTVILSFVLIIVSVTTTKAAHVAPVVQAEQKSFSGCADGVVMEIYPFAPGIAYFVITWNQTTGTNKGIKIESGSGVPYIISTSEHTSFFGTLAYRGVITVSGFVGNQANTCWSRSIAIDTVFPE